jgi:DNA-binding transcriptional ArsR family regulator
MHDGDKDRHRTAWAFTHPDRAAILDHLESVDLASGREIAEAVGQTPPTTAYHLHVLRNADLVERVGTMFDRGRAQNFYAATTGETLRR